jgi:hypothetical protein
VGAGCSGAESGSTVDEVPLAVAPETFCASVISASTSTSASASAAGTLSAGGSARGGDDMLPLSMWVRVHDSCQLWYRDFRSSRTDVKAAVKRVLSYKNEEKKLMQFS